MVFFFAPRRLVNIQILPAPADFPFKSSKRDLNSYLECWYNSSPDTLQRTPFYFWKKEAVEISLSGKKQEKEEVMEIPQEIETSVWQQLSKLSRRSLGEVKHEMRLAQDLGLDSLDMAELSFFLDERYGVTHLIPGSMQTVYDVMLAASGHSKEAVEENRSLSFDEPLKKWQSDLSRPGVMLPKGATLQEAFLLSCDRMGHSIACADRLSGVLSYRQLKIAALVLSRQIAKIPGNNIGILLPASIGAYLVILAVLLAKKVPVMLNWTAGQRSLDHSLDLAQVESVLSSDRFLSRLENVELGEVEEKFYFLEEIKRGISWKEKLRGWIAGFLSSAQLMQQLKLDSLKGEDRAVILFTSGTETLPKGVPLSHSNLLSNQRAALSCIDATERDILYGFLPPFHLLFCNSIKGLSSESK